MTAKERLRQRAAGLKTDNQPQVKPLQMPALKRAEDRKAEQIALAEQEAAAQKEAQRQKVLSARTAGLSNPREPVQKTPVSDRAKKVAEIRKDIDTTPVQSRVGKAAQSIGMSTAGSLQYLGETMVQNRENVTEYQQGSGLKEKADEALNAIKLARTRYGEGSEEHLQAQAAYDALREEIKAYRNINDKPVSNDSLGSRMMGESNRLKEEALEGTEGVTRFLGETAMSVASNVAKLPLGALAPVAMGAEAAAHKAYELQQQGVGAGQAMTRGVTSGVIEGITEKMGLDNLFDLVKTGGKTALKNVLKQAGVEGTEEGFSYAFNLVADKLAKDPNADFSWQELLESIASGAVSGLFFGAAGTAANRVGAQGYVNEPMSLPMVEQRNDIAPGVIKTQETVTNLPLSELGSGQNDTEPQPLPMVENKNTAGQSQAAEEVSKKTARAETAAIVNKLKRSVPDLADMSTLSVVKGTEFNGEKGKLTETVGEFFRSIGGKIFRKGFGDVLLTSKGIKTDISHGIGRAKAATFAAVPDIIANGRQIDYQQNWKGRGKDSYVFAGPVEMAGKRAYVAAVVLKDTDNRFYLHEVVDEDGNVIFMKKDATWEGQDRNYRRNGITEAQEASTEAYQVSDAEAPNRTAKTELEITPNSSIRQNGESVKPDPVEPQTFPMREIKTTVPRGQAMERGDSFTVAEKPKSLPMQDETAFVTMQSGNKMHAEWEFNGGRVEANEELERLQVFFDGKPSEEVRKEMRANGFLWAPSQKAWQRKLTDNAYAAAGRLSMLQPSSGKSVAELQREALKAYGDRKIQERLAMTQAEQTVTEPDPVEPTGLPMKNEEQTVTPFTQEDYRKHYPSSPKAPDVQERGPETEDEFLQSLTVEEPVAAETESAKEWIERNSGNWDTYVEIVGEQAQLVADERTDPTEKVKADRSQSRKTIRQKLGDTKREFLRKMVDSGDEIDRMGKAVKDSTLYAYYNQARAASNTAVRMITGKQSDVNGKTVGKGLNEIFQPIKQQGDDYYNAFQLYLYHRHNQDRMNRYDSTAVEAAQEAFQRYKAETKVLQPYSDVQIAQMAQEPWNNWQMEAQEYQRLLTELRKAENTRNKPVFGYDVTALDSEAAAEGLLREHPEFETMAQEVYQYVDNLMQYRVDSGLITAQDAAQLKQVYPHYVPTYRDIDTSGKARQKQRGVQVGKTIGRAEGGNEVLMPIHEALAKQTMSVVREGSKNRFGQRLMADATRNKEAVRSQVKNIQEAQSSFSVDDFDSDKDLLEDTKMTNTFVVREDGKRYEMEVSPEMYEGISVLSPEIKDTNEMVKIVRASNDLFKKLVTSYNPAFTVRNLVRDQQEAWVNSKDLAGYLKAYPEAIREITRGGQYWEQYQALGGVYASLFDSSTRMTTDQSTLEKATAPARKLIGRIEAINQAVEQAPRLAEFIATVKKGDGSMDNLMEAMYNAAEVTTNFGRSGTWGKFLNANFVPFLNPGVQGFDKMVRNFTETKGVVPWMKLAGKTAVLGIGAGVLNAMLWGDDEEWDELKQRDKDVYYLFKIKDGLWAKIPKGRVMSVYGMVADRAGKAIRGEEVDLGEFIETAANQIAPANPLENNIASAWVGTKLFDRSDPGETWYGTDIESQRLQKYEPGERYDEDTDKVSKAIGQALNLSPKKINYLLNQYTGVVGDIVLPLLTPAAEKNFLVSNFTVDSVTSSKRNSDFYETMEDLEYAKNARAASGADQASYRWWNKVSSAVSEVNQAIRAIESNENLSDAEKLEQTRVQYAVRNALQAEAAASLETYKAAADKWYQQGEGMEESDRSDYAYLMANREIFGAEYALKTYNKSTYEKAQEANDEGLSYDDYFDGYFQMQNIEDAVEGSAARRAKYSEWVNERYTGETRQQMLGLFLTDSQMAKLEEAESAGVAAEIYMDFDTFYSEAKSDATSEKQEKVIKYINSLPVSSEQKTALYLVNYKESGLKKTPWYNSKQEIVGLPMLEQAGNAEQFTMPVLELPSRASSGWEMPALMLP